jgi:hypothetical protein
LRSTGWVLVGLLSSVPLRAAAAAPGDAFVCYTTARADGEPKFRRRLVAVSDERDTRSLFATIPRELCIPADLGAGLRDPDTALLGYKARLPKGEPSYDPGVGVQILDQLGELYADVKTDPIRLLVPTATDPSIDPPAPNPAVHAVDHYRCHKAAPAAGAGFTPTQQVVIADGATGATLFELTRLRQLCEPVDAQGVAIKNAANHLACYGSRRARGEPKYQAVAGLRIANQFGAARLDTKRDVEICLPSRAVDHCNGFRELCDRAFDAVAYATTHNAMSNAEDGFLGPNQQYAVRRQLDDGVRGLMLDLWYFDGDVVLCHAGDVIPCDRFGMRPLVDGLADIKAFLDQHPNEIVSIIFESYVTEADVEADFIASGLTAYVHSQPATAPWPTLRALIEADKRLIVFTDDSGAALSWHHYVWDYAWETHFSFDDPADFSCTINRGAMSNGLFILNHFLTRLLGSPLLADMVNHNPLFIDRAVQCQTDSGRLPNFVTVDFYDIGDLFAVVDELNGVGP